MAKPHLVDRPKKVKVSIPESVFNQVHLLLLDPLRARTRYGSMSKLMTNLMRTWLDDQRKEKPDGLGSTAAGPEIEGLEEGRSLGGRVQHGDDGPPTDPADRSAEGGKGEEALDIA